MCQITEIPHDLNYLLSLTSSHINFDTQEAETQRRKVEFKKMQN